MVNLLNTVRFFGKAVEADYTQTVAWLIVIQVLFAVTIISLSLYLWLILRNNKRLARIEATPITQALTDVTEVVSVLEYGSSTTPDRLLTGITLDLAGVPREFSAGDIFNCSGLAVRAEYNLDPMSVTMVDYTVVDNDTYTRLKVRDKANGVYVIKPYMYTPGEKFVAVKYENYSAIYTIDVKEKHGIKLDEAPTVPHAVVEQSIALQTSEIVETVVERSRELLSISINTDNVQKEFIAGDAINCNGLVVVAQYNMEPIAEEISDYTVMPPDMNLTGASSVIVTYQGQVAEYTINIKNAPHVVLFEFTSEEAVQCEAPISEQVPDTIVRYDKSFTARLIQSEDDIKYWYTDIKNELLSYKGVKARTSWKRETFKCGGKLVLAKLAYRGKTLCLFLPLNPLHYGLEYPVEDASILSCYEDTPLMIRIRNLKRMEIARELINTVMEQNNMVRVPYESVDYYMPYEGLSNLVRKGLIKRNVRTSEDEAFFDSAVAIDEEEGV